MNGIVYTIDFLLNLPCNWDHERPNIEKVLISLLYGAYEPFINHDHNLDFLTINDKRLKDCGEEFNKAFQFFLYTN